jgi:hypothetical protein
VLLPRLPPWEVWEGRVGIDPQVGERGFERRVRDEGAGATLTRCSPGADLLGQSQPEPDLVQIDTRQMNAERFRHLREPQKKPARPKELGDEPIFEGIAGDDVRDRSVEITGRHIQPPFALCQLGVKHLAAFVCPVHGLLALVEDGLGLGDGVDVVVGDPVRGVRAEVFAAIAAAMADPDYTVAEIIAAARGNTDAESALRLVASADGEISPKRLGKWLAAAQNAISGGYKLLRTGTVRDRVRWRLEPVTR